MEFNVGIEMRDEYKRLEVAKGAMKLIRDVMLVKPYLLNWLLPL